MLTRVDGSNADSQARPFELNIRLISTFRQALSRRLTSSKQNSAHIRLNTDNSISGRYTFTILLHLYKRYVYN